MQYEVRRLGGRRCWARGGQRLLVGGTACPLTRQEAVHVSVITHRLSSGDAGGFRLSSDVADKGRGPRLGSGDAGTDGLRLGSGDADTGRGPRLSSGTLERLGCAREGEGEAWPPAKVCTGNASGWSDLARGLLGDGLAGTRDGSDLSEVVRFCSASPANVRS